MLLYRAKEDPLLGANYMYRLIYETLLGDEMFDFTNAVIFFDSAFTSVKLVRDLHNNRGISAVGRKQIREECGGRLMAVAKVYV